MTTSRDERAAGRSGRGCWPSPGTTQATPTRPRPTSSRRPCSWAITHPAESIEEAETIRLRSFGDTAIPLAGPGAPLVAEFSLAEFAATIGLPTEAGKRYVGHALELRYRLPRLWKRVVAGDLAAWKARRIADQTLHLTHRGRQVRRPAPRPGRPQGPPQPRSTGSSRKPSPGTCPRKPKNAAAPPGTRPTSPSTTTASASPAPAPSPARSTTSTPSTSTTPSAPKPNASATSATPRPSTNAAPSPSATSPAATSPSTTPPHATHRPTDRPADRPPPRQPDKPTRAAGRSCSTCTSPRPPSAAPATMPEPPAAQRSGGWRTPAPRSPPRPSATGSAAPTCKVTVKPVVDLAEHVSVEAYEVPDRIAEPAALRDISCVFPWCTRPARRLRPDQHPCDNDHPVPYHQGGPTCSCQIAPLCRRHHRLKTHGGWTYHVLEPGSYLWTSPHGYQYLRDHTGTLDISRRPTPLPTTHRPDPATRPPAPPPAET